MKKTAAILLALALLAFSVSGLAEGAPDYRKSRLVLIEAIYDVEAMPGHDGAEGSTKQDSISAQSLAEALMLVTSGRADGFFHAYDSLRYIASRNEGFKAMALSHSETLHIIAAEKNAALITGIDQALEEMEADGTLAALWQTHVEDVIEGADPVAVDLPYTEGLETYQIGVSGDMPPIDYTTPDGAPAGYNTALLAELSTRIGVNFKLISVESGARYTALAAGTIDGFFWHEQVAMPTSLSDAQQAQAEEVLMQNVNFLISRPYCTLELGVLIKAE